MQNGLMEYWNTGIMGEDLRKSYGFNPSFQHSIIPFFLGY
jgi:hypothetical protein